ncbi:hypothetical protein SKAU_G00138620 [Synaphobranchus kaupii]|uniref:Uncharacterized protein n=1 Tax=Synaphobranchus kaupii TaxID=118154 RepID=A0A9Q1J3S2_SYNKA|nr:hypothetical protein SKAU_G00138620 [Synaphobranchus kaupii]
MVEDKAKGELTQQLGLTAYKKVNETVLAQVIIFNKRREGEASRVTLETYKEASTNPMNEDIYETLTDLEKEMSKLLTRIEVRGKRGRKTDKNFQIAKISKLLFAMEQDAGTLKEKNLTSLNPAVSAESPTSTSVSVPQRRRKRGREVVEDPSTSLAKRLPQKKRGKKKGAVKETEAPKVQLKRPWSEAERTAVNKRLGKFIAERRVPGKEDCVKCITQEKSLDQRSWKDVKNFVYNTIVTLNRRLASRKLLY